MARRPPSRGLTVAVTGATGTVGPALLARLAAERDVGRIVVLARRRPTSLPAGADIDLRAIDVRDAAGVAGAVAGADVVVHAAFALYGVASREADLFATNVQGTLNVARAAAATGAERFVSTSSAAVYGFHGDNAQPLTEDAPIRASGHHFYSRHKAQVELLVAETLGAGDTESYVLRPCGVVGPDAAGGARNAIGAPLAGAGRTLLATAARAGLRPALPAPPVPLQFVHADDVAQALAHAAVGRGPAGVYNLAGEGALPGGEVLRLLGLRELPLPRVLVQGALRGAAAAPPIIPALGWAEILTEPIILATDKARSRLGWRPRFTSRAALQDTRRALGW
jgi:nucleoside-diphosphate-sugar epimerase